MANRSTVPVLVLVLCCALAGCGSLLPRGSSTTPSPFANFEQARSAAEQIVAFKTKPAELAALGFDPDDGKNVTLIPYPDIAARLAPNPVLPLSALDPGVRACIEAQTACHAYLFHFEQQDRKRQGNFWTDFLNVKRVTQVTGWWFDLLVVVNGDAVMFRNVAGQAHSDRLERQSNPLGPLQGAGESAGAILIH